MQDYVSYQFSKKRNKANKKRIFFIIALSILVVILIIVFSFYLKSNREAWLDETTYYIVYVDKGQKQAVLSAESEKVCLLGGAGKIITHEHMYYLVAYVYMSQEDATEIETNLKPNFPNTGVIKLSKKLNSKQKQLILSNKNYLECFKFIKNFISDLHISSINYMAGKLSESSLCSNILSKKAELEVLIKDFERLEDGFSEKILAFENLCLLHINNFCDEFFTSTKKQSVLTLLLTNLVLAESDLLDNL